MPSDSVAGSFRDPSGFVFRCDGSLYRQVNLCYREDYDLLISSGLCERLTSSGMLVSHEEVNGIASSYPEAAYRVLKPEEVPFISYPYEWSFSQLKDAALATLAVQKTAIECQMTLKDCSAYNIQFLRGKPIFIDTLSFERHVEGNPWTPYGQFCRHFLAPLALMSRIDVRLNRLLQIYIDGVPLDLASSMLPYRTRFSLPLAMHIHLHAKSQARYSDAVIEKAKFRQKMSRTALLGLIDNLESTVRGMRWKPAGTEWADYYSDDSYSAAAFEAKQRIVEDYLAEAGPASVWDLGANNGFFTRIAGKMGAQTVAFDVDSACVEMNYLQAKKAQETRILPLLLDLTNPSPGIGWANEERMPISSRGPVDLIMALALIHHIAISNNVPLVYVAELLSGMCKSLIIEFVPKSDHKVQKLLATREDVFPNYTQEAFEAEFDRYFTIRRSDNIAGSERTLYLLARK